MASYNDIRMEQAGQQVKSENAAAINGAREKQAMIDQAQQEQAGQVAQNQQAINFQNELRKAQTANPELQRKMSIANAQNQEIANAQQMYERVMANAGRNNMGMAQDGSSTVFNDSRNMADIRGAQELQREADAQNLAADQQSGYSSSDAYGAYLDGALVDPTQATGEAEYAADQLVKRGFPNPNDPATQDAMSLDAYMAARGR